MERTGNILRMNATSEQAGPVPTELDAPADQAIAAGGGDARETVKALIVANDFLETQLDELRRRVSCERKPVGRSTRASRSTELVSRGSISQVLQLLARKTP